MWGGLELSKLKITDRWWCQNFDKSKFRLDVGDVIMITDN
jgi:hypothetical protein